MSRAVIVEPRYVAVDQERYDELLHKEALLAYIGRLHSRMSDYLFRDAIGHLLNTEMVQANEQE